MPVQPPRPRAKNRLNPGRDCFCMVTNLGLSRSANTAETVEGFILHRVHRVLLRTPRAAQPKISLVTSHSADDFVHRWRNSRFTLSKLSARLRSHREFNRGAVHEICMTEPELVIGLSIEVHPLNIWIVR